MIETLIAALLVYYVCLHGLYAMLIVLGATQLRRYQLGITFGEYRRIAESPLTMPISLVIPAYNEEKVIVNTVLGALKLRYPQHEVIVVNDGSSDKTVDVLIEHFELRSVRKVGQRHFDTKPISGVYVSAKHPNLVVVDKANGRRADAINAGVNLARYPLLCIIDADSILERDALLHVVRPFQRNVAVAAATGMVRPANGLVVENGEIASAQEPRGTLALMQAVEYLRSFQWARLGLARLSSMLCISGAFMVLRKDVFVAMNGVDPTSITDDIEFTVRLHRWVYEQPAATRPRICYVPDAVCYTEVPETHRVYAAQRNRWQRGTLQALLRNWTMTFNPRYGLAGLFGMPFFLFFEAAAAIVEGLSYVLIPVAVLLGLATLTQLAAFFALAVLLGSVLSVAAILLQETTRLRVERTRDLVRLIGAAFVENLLYHQLHLLWRIGGTFDYLVRRRTDLGLMMRYGSFQR